MDTKTLIIVLVPSVLSILASMVNVFLNVSKERRRKSEMAWEAAKEIVLRSNFENHYPEERDAEDVAIYFHHLYKRLKMIESGEFEKHALSQPENDSNKIGP